MKAALMLGLATALLAVGGGSTAALPASPVPSTHAPLAAPSSSLLTFVTWRSGVQMIASRRVDGGQLREIMAGDQPRWSPDGRRLLYVVHPNGRSDLSVLHVIDSGGQHGHVVANGTAPSWSPDGTKIVLRNPAGRIAVASVASGRALRVLAQPAGALSLGPIWSPDGRWQPWWRSCGALAAGCPRSAQAPTEGHHPRSGRCKSNR